MLNLIKSGKCKLKPQWNAILHPLAWQKWKTLAILSVWENVPQLGALQF